MQARPQRRRFKYNLTPSKLDGNGTCSGTIYQVSTRSNNGSPERNRMVVLGQLFKNATRGTNKRYMYKKHEGDLSASEITMCDDARIELMIKVKEGKITMHEAVEKVKDYERQRSNPSSNESSPIRHDSEAGSPSRGISGDTRNQPDSTLGSCSQERSAEGRHAVNRGTKKISVDDKTASIFGITATSGRHKSVKSENCKDLSHSKSAEICFPTKSASPKRGLLGSKSFEAKLPLSEKPAGEPCREEKDKKSFVLRSPFSCRKRNDSQGSDSDNSIKAKKKQLSKTEASNSSRGQPKAGQTRGGRVTAPSTSRTSTCSQNRAGITGNRTNSTNAKSIDKRNIRTNVSPINAQKSSLKQAGPGASSRIPAPSSVRPGRSRGSGSASDSQSETERSLRRTSGIATRPASQDTRSSRLTRDRQKDISGTKRGDRRSTGVRHSSQSDGSRSETDDSRSRSPSTTSKLLLKTHESTSKGPVKLYNATRTASISQAGTRKARASNVNETNASSKTKKERPVSSLHRAQNQELFTTTIVNVTTPPSPRILKQRRQPPPLTTFESTEPVWQRRTDVAAKASSASDRIKEEPQSSQLQSQVDKPIEGHAKAGSECGDLPSAPTPDEGLIDKSAMFVRGGSGRHSLSEKMKGLGRDVRKKIARLRPQRSGGRDEEVPDGWDDEANDITAFENRNHNHTFSPASTSSSPSSMSVEDEEPAFRGPFVGRARVIRDCTPSPYDKEALTLKRGDIVSVISKGDTGIWRGFVRNKVGTFKFINVELLPEASLQTTPIRARSRGPRSPRRPRPRTVQELLQRLQLQHLTSTFLLHGFETLELLSTLEEEDLDELAITNSEDRAKLLTAAQMLLDYEDVDYSSSSSSPVISCHPVTNHESNSTPNGSPGSCASSSRIPHILGGTAHVRDSGCYASVETLQQGALEIVDLDEINLNGNIPNTLTRNDNNDRRTGDITKTEQGTSIVTHNLTYQASESKNHIIHKNNKHTPLQNETMRLLSYEKFTFKSASSESLEVAFANNRLSKLPGISHGSEGDIVNKTSGSFDSLSSIPVQGTGSQRSLSDPPRTAPSQGSPRSILKNRDTPSPVSSGGTQTPPSMGSPLRRTPPQGPRIGLVQQAGSPMGSPIRGRSPSNSPTRIGSPHGSPSRSPYMASPLASPNRTPSPSHHTQYTSPSQLGSPQRLSRATPPPLPVRIKPAVPERRSSLQRYLTSSCGQTYVYTSPVMNGDTAWRRNVDYANLPTESDMHVNGRVEGRRLSSPSLQIWTPPHSPHKSKLPTPQGSSSLQCSPQTSPVRNSVVPHDTLVSQRAPRPISVTGEALVMAKIEAEGIDLTDVPYTDKCGFCGIPPALVQRYSEELKREVKDMASMLDECRIRQLQKNADQRFQMTFLVTLVAMWFLT